MNPDQTTPENQIVNPFTDVNYVEMPRSSVPGQQVMSDVQELQVGAGTKVLRSNKQGIWLGAKHFADAPFSVDMSGNMIANSFTTNDYVPVGGAATDVNSNSGTINANRINATTLSAISANLGTITAGDISGVTIAIGSANNIFKADTNGIYLGNATFASAPFRVSMAGAVNASNITITGGSLTIGSNFSVDTSGNVTLNSWNLNSGDIVGISGGIAFKNTKGIYYYNSGNSSLKASLTMDGSNVFSLYNSTGIIDLRASSYVSLVASSESSPVEVARAQTDGSLLIATIKGSGGTINLGDNVHIASTKNLVFDGTQGSINCGSVNCNDIEMNSHDLNDVTKIKWVGQSSGTSASDHQQLTEDDGSTQRMRIKFANNGTQWSFNLSSICTPVRKKDYDPIYFEKYDLMDNLEESRFAKTYKNTNDVQKEYRGRPVSHFPSLGDSDGLAQKRHNDALWKRPWLPMKRIPDRMETMGQYPYPPVHSELIGENESGANMYQLLAHAYNQLQERFDKLEAVLKEKGINV